MNTSRIALTVAGIALACGSFCLGFAAAPAHTPATLPPCATEDATNCFWDATTRGNGQGSSFVDLNGVAYYAE